MVADQEHCRYVLTRQAHDLARKFALIGGAGIASFESITTEHDEIGIVLNGIIHDLAHASDKVQDALVYTSSRVNLPKILHTDMNIGKVQKPDRLGRSHREDCNKRYGR